MIEYKFYVILSIFPSFVSTSHMFFVSNGTVVINFVLFYSTNLSDSIIAHGFVSICAVFLELIFYTSISNPSKLSANVAASVLNNDNLLYTK